MRHLDHQHHLVGGRMLARIAIAARTQQCQIGLRLGDVRQAYRVLRTDDDVVTGGTGQSRGQQRDDACVGYAYRCHVDDLSLDQFDPRIVRENAVTGHGVVVVDGETVAPHRCVHDDSPAVLLPPCAVGPVPACPSAVRSAS